VIHLIIPAFPPSTNKAYYVRNGRMHLSDKGKAFKETVVAHITQKYMKEMRIFKKNMPYLVYIRFVFADGIENKGWPKKCDTRYKIWDGTNRVKLTEDALKEAFGVDDSQFMAVIPHKWDGGTDAQERFEVFVWSLEEERSPLDEFIKL
jgi:hypothetical protein